MSKPRELRLRFPDGHEATVLWIPQAILQLEAGYEPLGLGEDHRHNDGGSVTFSMVGRDACPACEADRREAARQQDIEHRRQQHDPHEHAVTAKQLAAWDRTWAYLLADDDASQPSPGVAQ